MMHIPYIAPISDMRLRQSEIIEKTKLGPVVLVERGSKPALVVVSPEQWNNLADQLEYLEDVAAIYKRKWELATGEDELIELSPDTLHQWLSDDVPA